MRCIQAPVFSVTQPLKPYLKDFHFRGVGSRVDTDPCFRVAQRSRRGDQGGPVSPPSLLSNLAETHRM